VSRKKLPRRTSTYKPESVGQQGETCTTKRLLCTVERLSVDPSFNRAQRGSFKRCFHPSKYIIKRKMSEDAEKQAPPPAGEAAADTVSLSGCESVSVWFTDLDMDVFLSITSDAT
jgi:hypothetical protein